MLQELNDCNGMYILVFGEIFSYLAQPLCNSYHVVTEIAWLIKHSEILRQLIV